MTTKSAKKQTFLVTMINAIVRALGLILRVILSRFLGAEIMGISELAQSVHMVAITPLTSGLPVAISRLTARAHPSDMDKPLGAGLKCVRLASLVLIPLLWVLSPVLARVLGDIRVLPSLLITAPCILVLGYSAALNGYCYGREWSHYPANSELLEQLLRLIFSIFLLFVLRRLTSAWLAAVPVLATLLAEIAGLCYILSRIRFRAFSNDAVAPWQKPLLRLAVPATASRIVQTLLRSWTAILIPIRLQQSGLSKAESMSQLGMLNGMVMPILMLPCVFTSALSMVSLPRLAKAEEKPGELRRLLGLCAASCSCVALLCAAAIYVFSPYLSIYVYRLPELADIFRISWPLTILFTFAHLTGSILSALGQQKRSLYASSAVSLLTLLLTWQWAGRWRMTGVLMAQAVGQLILILLSILIVWLWKRERQAR